MLNAFTDDERAKLSGIESGAQVNVPSSFLTSAVFVKNANLAAGSYMVMGEVSTADDDGFIIPIDLSIESVTISRTDTDAADLEILCDGVVKATVATSSINTVDSSMSVLCPAGSVIVVRNIAGGNTMSNVICAVWFEGAL